MDSNGSSMSFADRVVLSELFFFHKFWNYCLSIHLYTHYLSQFKLLKMDNIIPNNHQRRLYRITYHRVTGKGLYGLQERRKRVKLTVYTPLSCWLVIWQQKKQTTTWVGLEKFGRLWIRFHKKGAKSLHFSVWEHVLPVTSLTNDVGSRELLKAT